jgi:hypothetical protein
MKIETAQVQADLAAAQWQRFGRPFASHAHLSAALKRALVNLGVRPVRATYDPAGNCKICGEAGRCGGWHTPGEASAAQQARAEFERAPTFRVLHSRPGFTAIRLPDGLTVTYSAGRDEALRIAREDYYKTAENERSAAAAYIATHFAAPLPTGAGDLTADAFNGGDTPLFNHAWAGGAL